MNVEPLGAREALKRVAKWGAVIGLGSYLVAQLGLDLLNIVAFGAGSADIGHPESFSLACLGIFGLLFAFSAAGYFTGRETLRAGWGALAAALALVIYSALSALYTPQATPTAAPTPHATGGAAAAALVAKAVAGLLTLGVAALMGWLGGRPGAANARRRLAAR